MVCNVGKWDRIVRIAVGVALLTLVFNGPQTLWGLVGLVPLLSGIVRFCPGYAATGVSTCGSEHS